MTAREPIGQNDTGIEVEIADGIGELRLARPSKRNALSLHMLEGIARAQQKLVKAGIRGLILTGDGPAFCAGHDFADMAGADVERMRRIFRACAEVMLGFQSLPFPVVAAVRGPAVGAGCQLALACDLVVAGKNAVFQTPGGRGAWFCTTPMVEIMRAAAPKRALEMLFTGEPISAGTALDWGMVNRVVEDGDVGAEARKLLDMASRGSPASKAAGKQAFHSMRALPHEKAYDLATEIMASSGAGAEAQDAMKQIVAGKRKAL